MVCPRLVRVMVISPFFFPASSIAGNCVAPETKAGQADWNASARPTVGGFHETQEDALPEGNLNSPHIFIPEGPSSETILPLVSPSMACEFFRQTGVSRARGIFTPETSRFGNVLPTPAQAAYRHFRNEVGIPGMRVDLSSAWSVPFRKMEWQCGITTMARMQ